MTTIKSFSQALFTLALLSATPHHAKADACTDSVCGAICDKAPFGFGTICSKGCPTVGSTVISAACKSEDPCAGICDKFPVGTDKCKTACGKVGKDNIKKACEKCPASAEDAESTSSLTE